MDQGVDRSASLQMSAGFESFALISTFHPSVRTRTTALLRKIGGPGAGQWISRRSRRAEASRARPGLRSLASRRRPLVTSTRSCGPPRVACATDVWCAEPGLLGREGAITGTREILRSTRVRDRPGSEGGSMTSSFAVGAFARRPLGLALALALIGAGPAAAQTLFQGRIDVTVQDAQDRAVPGATVDIAGPATQQQVTDTSGEAHFLNLAPGVYTLTISLQGFNTYRNETVRVAAGTSGPLKATLQVGGVP